MELELEEEAAGDEVTLETPTGAPSMPSATETTPSSASAGRPIHLSASGAGVLGRSQTVGKCRSLDSFV